jgi:hypothetical protein
MDCSVTVRSLNIIWYCACNSENIRLSPCYSGVAKARQWNHQTACPSRPTACQPACICVCLPAYLPVTANEMFNLQIYWLNQAFVTLTIHLFSLSHWFSLSLCLPHSLITSTVNKNKVLNISIYYNQNDINRKSAIMIFLMLSSIFHS